MGLFEFILAMTLICTVGGIVTTGMQTGKRRGESTGDDEPPG